MNSNNHTTFASSIFLSSNFSVQALVTFGVLLHQVICLSAEPPAALEVNLHKPRDKVAIVMLEGRAVVTIESESGIGKAELKPAHGKWPKTLLLSLGLKDLEGFYAENDTVRIQTSLKQGEPEVSVPAGEGERKAIPATERHRIKVKRVADRIEVELPAVLLGDGKSPIRVQWIDYYR